MCKSQFSFIPEIKFRRLSWYFLSLQDWCEWREVKAKQLANKAEQQQGKDQVSNIIKDEPEKKAEIGILEDKDVHKKSVTWRLDFHFIFRFKVWSVIVQHNLTIVSLAKASCYSSSGA